MASSSGVSVADECLQLYSKDLKLEKKLKYIIYKLSDDKKEIIVDTSSSDSNYDAFVESLPQNDCRFAVYDFEYEKGEGKRNKLLFFGWSPDNAPVKQKMVYASSKSNLRQRLDGISNEVQATDFDEVSHDTVLEKASRGA